MRSLLLTGNLACQGTLVSPPMDVFCFLCSDQGKHTGDGFLLRTEDTNDKLSVIDDTGGVALAIPCDRLRLPERDGSGG